MALEPGIHFPSPAASVACPRFLHLTSPLPGQPAPTPRLQVVVSPAGMPGGGASGQQSAHSLPGCAGHSRVPPPRSWRGAVGPSETCGGVREAGLALGRVPAGLLHPKSQPSMRGSERVQESGRHHPSLISSSSARRLQRPRTLGDPPQDACDQPPAAPRSPAPQAPASERQSFQLHPLLFPPLWDQRCVGRCPQRHSYSWFLTLGTHSTTAGEGTPSFFHS